MEGNPCRVGSLWIKTELDSAHSTAVLPLSPFLLLSSPHPTQLDAARHGFYDATATACHFFNLLAQLDAASTMALSSCSYYSCSHSPCLSLSLSVFLAALLHCHLLLPSSINPPYAQSVSSVAVFVSVIA